MGKYTGMDIMLGSELNFHAIQNKLNPKIGSFAGTIEDELDFAMGQDFPKCQGRFCLLKSKNILTGLSQNSG